MALESSNIPWIEATFLENQRNFPRAELLRYAGQHIAWSWEGDRVLASDPDRGVLRERLRTAGIDPCRVVYDYVEDPGLSYLM